MAESSCLGYPRIGPSRELKKSLERYWASEIDEAALNAEAAGIRRAHWQTQKAAGIELVPSGDFSLYDHVLDTAMMLDAVPPRYRGAGRAGLGEYFSMARGSGGDGNGIQALEMTKWFDTNYHYIVPEVDPRGRFRLASTKPLDHFLEARALGIETRPVLLGPVTFFSLAKTADGSHAPLSLIDEALPVYEEILRRLSKQGARWVQIDEPVLVTDIDARARDAFPRAYARLAGAAGKTAIMLATYFGELGENLGMALDLPIGGLHVDLVRAPGQLDRILERKPESLVLSLGLVDGRNVWKADLETAVAAAEKCADAVGESRVIVAPSCSLLHCPEDLSLEDGLDRELKGWLSFAKQKLEEVVLISRAVNEGRSSVAEELARNRQELGSRAGSPRVVNPRVRARAASVTPDMRKRTRRIEARREIQARELGLPLFPATTIGSFPQTKKVRSMRAAFRNKEIGAEEYERFLEQEIRHAIGFQESLGMDVLVHGEFERTDMVEYFAQMLHGFAFTSNGWVQSYGSRCVKPPIIYGDVERAGPMTVRWASFAQSLSSKPVKGMLTGPVTIAAWSFARDDQPMELTCRQIALAIRDEVGDLEASGLRVIQIDEPAFREILPLRAAERGKYLAWAVDAFRLASSGARDSTQIHTHMCYSHFSDIVPAIAAMDADVISIESARSRMELLGAFRDFRYPGAIGPGVYDIHSPRVPEAGEILALLEKALEVLEPRQLWVNPDCGLKTRQWKEVEPSLRAMLEAARSLREKRGS
jgi:5-methyltetrahydropteroyltriglutamate--homocysteine methyltransferase